MCILEQIHSLQYDLDGYGVSRSYREQVHAQSPRLGIEQERVNV